jgi:hypothetical protein
MADDPREIERLITEALYDFADRAAKEAAEKMRQRCAEVAARHAKELLDRNLSERDQAADTAETIEREILGLPLDEEPKP